MYRLAFDWRYYLLVQENHYLRFLHPLPFPFAGCLLTFLETDCCHRYLRLLPFPFAGCHLASQEADCYRYPLHLLLLDWCLAFQAADRCCHFLFSLSRRPLCCPWNPYRIFLDRQQRLRYPGSGFPRLFRWCHPTAPGCFLPVAGKNPLMYLCQ